MRKTTFATLALTALISGEAFSQTTTWSTVATEYQQFSLSSARTVRYGSGTSWVQKSLSGTQECSNQTFGSDPARGLTKMCQVATTTASTTTAPTTSTASNTTTTTTWSTVASEYANFSLSGTKTVRYGVGSSWVQKSLSGTQECSNQTFGTDPASGLAKMCQVATTTTTSTSGTTSGTSGSTTTTTATWSTVASEYASFSISGTKTVRYGAGSSWIQKTLSGTQTCSNATFGSDPAYGLAKTCQVSSISPTGSTGSTGGTTTTPKSYSARLSWTIPTTRTDGRALAVGELSGYQVYYTNDSGSVSASVNITGGTTINTLVSNLPSGIYHFSISAVDTAGLKSPLSTMASLTFP